MIGVLVFDSRRWLGIFLFITVSRTAPGPTQSPIQRVPGVLSLRVKRPGREADHIHLVPRLRMCGAIPPLPQYISLARCLVKHTDNFTFTFTSLLLEVSLPLASISVLGFTQPPIQLVLTFTPVVKRPEREADHSPQCRIQEFVQLHFHSPNFRTQVKQIE
jgi:hypothetical protein